MAQLFKAVLIVFSTLAGAAAQGVPAQLQGKWVVQRVLPTNGVSCWSYKEGRRLIGSEIKFTANAVRWRDQVANNPDVTVSEISAEQFRREYSGSGGGVSLSQLGIRATRATRISFKHSDMKPIKGAFEIVAEDVFIKDENTIIIDACGVYFETVREPSPSGVRN